MNRLSALVDGELESDEAAQEFKRLRDDPEAREAWDTYHLIGDAMRAQPVMRAGFDRRFAERLAAEPTVLAPVTRPARRVSPAFSYALSAAASIAAVAVVGWMAFSGSAPDTPTAAPGNLAGIAQPAPVTVPLQAAQDNGGAHDYLLAHQGVSPSTALQGVAPYVRTVALARDGGR